MQNNIPSKEAILDVFKQLSQRCSSFWFKYKQTDISYYIDNPDSVRSGSPTIELELDTESIAGIVEGEHIAAMQQCCGDCKVKIVADGLDTFDRVDLTKPHNSNLTIVTNASSIRFNGVEFFITPNLKFSSNLHELRLWECTISPSMVPTSVKSLCLMCMDDFSNVEKIKASNITISYKTAQNIPTNWSKFPMHLHGLKIFKHVTSTDPSDVAVSMSKVIISSKTINDMIAHFKSISRLMFKTRGDALDGPINLVSMAMWNVHKFEFNTMEPNLQSAFNVFYVFCVDKETNITDVINMQEQLIEIGLEQYAK